jgi:TRAP transporter TAXI family solute receptor
VAGRAVGRRGVLRAGALLGLAAALPTGLAACSSPFAGRRLTVATGNTQGVYFIVGTKLAELWQHDLGLDTAPKVSSTAGSVDNLLQLDAGEADVAFCQIDAAARQLTQLPADDPRSPRALARIYDDVVHLVVPAGSPVATPAQLRGLRVSVGAPESGVSLVARRMLEVAGLTPGTDLSAEQLDLTKSADALAAGRLDAFFWVGGQPTQGITDLARAMPIRLVDLETIVGPARKAYPEYAAGTLPAMTYGMPEPITTLLVRNVLLVTADMPDDLVAALAAALFGGQEALAEASPVALTIDPRAAIGTQPVPLHPGAEAFYRASKDD